MFNHSSGGLARDTNGICTKAGSVCRWSCAGRAKLKPAAKVTISAGFRMFADVCGTGGRACAAGDWTESSMRDTAAKAAGKTQHAVSVLGISRAGRQAGGSHGPQWKAVRLNVAQNPDGPIELYDLYADPGEKKRCR